MKRPERQGLYDPQFEHESCGVGFVANMKGEKSHEIVEQGLQILVNLEHRGACGFEENTGDGAGILIQMPHKFLAGRAPRRSTSPSRRPANTAWPWCSSPPDKQLRQKIEERFEQVVRAEGQKFLGWRTVPTDNSTLGETAKSEEPEVRMAFVGRNPVDQGRPRLRAEALRHPPPRSSTRSATPALPAAASSTSRAFPPAPLSTRAC